MITPKSIIITSKDCDLTGDWIIRATYMIRSEMTVSRHILTGISVPARNIIQDAVERCIQKVWRMIYGDIKDDLLHLRMSILRESGFSTETAEECGRIIAKLD